MTRWPIKSAARVGLIIGLVGMAVEMIKPDAPALTAVQLVIYFFEVMVPVLLFAAVAWVQNRLAKGSG